ncbi:hypothetical protein DDV21_007720 [Streptococcus chenjunshii]|uniref:Uncharacterized protein n=1 Tax=Streptococcus chenjunshii TaxID=2173853 RepID=A0A372KMV3_9STRE|nr:hypothetical protein [Streptococcus chenjunshii]AXQ78982.1 hypothetical protein DDV21_007720 [Streptococcus chenjunshii]RFU51409.1 hypothetical protein DDV22_03610 [Streptococcus chenjunshii]RFU53609.1 hypothetical protein DDV23_03600 [Streptococcus chenjunshii]
MKSKKLAQVSAVTGLIGGIIILLDGMQILMSDEPLYYGLGAIAETFAGEHPTSFLIYLLMTLLRVGLLILGAVGGDYYEKDTRVGNTPGILMNIGSTISVISYFSWIGGSLIIVSSLFYFRALRKFTK